MAEKWYHKSRKYMKCRDMILMILFNSGAKIMLDVSGRTNEEIKQLLLRVWLRQLAIGLLVFAVGCLVTGSGAGRTALAGGVLWGVLDGALLLGGTARALQIPILQHHLNYFHK